MAFITKAQVDLQTKQKKERRDGIVDTVKAARCNTKMAINEEVTAEKIRRKVFPCKLKAN